MADINVERRSRSIWPWILGLLVLAVLAWLLLSMFGGNDARETDETTTVETTSSVVAATPHIRAA